MSRDIMKNYRFAISKTKTNIIPLISIGYQRIVIESGNLLMLV